jgi:hypothetical protein
MAQPARQFYDFEDYLRLEAMSPIKHEWLDGTVWAWPEELLRMQPFR